jgi:hypothetical protein
MSGISDRRDRLLRHVSLRSRWRNDVRHRPFALRG